MPIYLDAEPVTGAAELDPGARQPAARESRVSDGEAHPMRVVEVTTFYGGTDPGHVDYFAVCGCGWNSLPYESRRRALAEDCAVAVAEQQRRQRIDLYGPMLCRGVRHVR